MSFQNNEKKIKIKEASIEIDGLDQLKNIKYLDNVLGCIYGNCLGDAYGLSTEFLNKESIAQKYPDPNVFIDFPNYITNKHNRRWDKGDWTDDTDQMILILQTLIENNGQINIKELANKLKNWVENGFEELGDQAGMGLGQTVASVVYHPSFKEYPTLVSKFIWMEGNKKMAANGSLMRTSILGCNDFIDDQKVVSNCVEVCKLTHYDSRCIVSCIIFTKIISDILKYYNGNQSNNNNNNNNDSNDNSNQDNKTQFIINEILNGLDNSTNSNDNKNNNGYYNSIANKLFEANQMITDQEKEEYINLFNQFVNYKEWEDLDLDEGSSIGYVYKCLGSSILSLRKFNQYYFNSCDQNQTPNKSQIFRKVLDELIREGGDSDTNGSTAGALLGTIIGYSNLPKDMLLSLPNKSWLDEQVVKFITILNDRITSNKINNYKFNLNDEIPSSYSNETDDKPYIDFSKKSKSKSYNDENSSPKNNFCSIQ